MSKKLIIVALLLTFVLGADARLWSGGVMMKGDFISKYQSGSLGAYLEACDPSYNSDDVELRNNNNSYCAGYNQAILESASYHKKACFSPMDVEHTVVLSLANIRVNQDKGAYNKNAFGELVKAVSAAFPCK